MDQLKNLLFSLTVKQRISLGVAALAVIAGLFGISHWNRERDFKPLYSGLSQEDAAAVLAKVREGGSEFRLSESGSSVLVPSSKVAELRLQLAAAGVPKSGRIGYELFDKVNFGTSDFAEQINYHRAVEGELERTVMALAEVEQARVHVTFPKDSVFSESKQAAKASVLLKLKPGAKLSAQNVLAVCQLMASAVEGLAPEAVSVVDMHGNVLSRPRKAVSPDSPEPDETMLDYKGKIERELIAKIGTTLEPLLGAERFRAGVSVDCDFTSGEQSEEILDPTKSVMVSSQKTEDVSGGANGASGVPGTPSNLPRPASRPGSGSPQVSRRTENVAYQSSRTVRRMRIPQGSVKRMSVSILVDNLVRMQGTGAKAKRIIESPAPEKMKAIRELIAGVIGFSADRGDQLVIESLPFESTLNGEPPASLTAPVAPAPGNLPPWLQDALKNKTFLIAGAAGALVLVGLLGFAMFAMTRKGSKTKPVDTKPAIAGSVAAEGVSVADAQKKMEAQLADQAAARNRQEIEALSVLKLSAVQTKKTEVLTKHINEEAKKDSKIMAQIVRTWIAEGGK